MSMTRICYFVPGDFSGAGTGARELERRLGWLRERAGRGVEVEIRDAPDGPASVESAPEERQAARAFRRALPGLQEEGFDAVIVGCFGDPGVEEARESAAIPVVGPAAASIHRAAQLAERFGILTVVDEVIPTLRELVRSHDMEPRLASLRAVEVPVLELRERRAEVVARLAAEGRLAVEEGADALILGCMTMGFLGVAEDLARELRRPVVNPALAALRAAEAMLVSRPSTSASRGS